MPRPSRSLALLPLGLLFALTACKPKTGGSGGFGGLLDRLKGGGTTAASGDLSGPLSVRELKENEFRTFVEEPGKLCVVVFHADWCGPCRVLKPRLEKVGAEFGKVAVVGRFNVDDCRSLAKEREVGSIPDVRFYRDGKQVDAFIGLADETELRAAFVKNSAGLAAPGAADSSGSGPGQTIQPMKKDWLPPGVERR